jgi:hypothetical protein
MEGQSECSLSLSNNCCTFSSSQRSTVIAQINLNSDVRKGGRIQMNVNILSRALPKLNFKARSMTRGMDLILRFYLGLKL